MFVFAILLSLLQARVSSVGGYFLSGSINILRVLIRVYLDLYLSSLLATTRFASNSIFRRCLILLGFHSPEHTALAMRIIRIITSPHLSNLCTDMRGYSVALFTLVNSFTIF